MSGLDVPELQASEKNEPRPANQKSAEFLVLLSKQHIGISNVFFDKQVGKL